MTSPNVPNKQLRPERTAEDPPSLLFRSLTAPRER